MRTFLLSDHCVGLGFIALMAGVFLAIVQHYG